MFSLIITIISIALVAALALATLYYGGGAFNKGSAEAEASKILLQGQQLLGAADLYYADHNVWPTLQQLQDSNYLKSVPTAAHGVGSAHAAPVAWTMPIAGQPVFMLRQDALAQDACSAVNQKGSLGKRAILARAYTALNAQCYGTEGSFKVIFKKHGSVDSLNDTDDGTVDIPATDVVTGPVPTSPTDPDWTSPPGDSGGNPGGGNPGGGSGGAFSVSPTTVALDQTNDRVAVTLNNPTASDITINNAFSYGAPWGAEDFYYIASPDLPDQLVIDRNTCGSVVAAGTSCDLAVSYLGPDSGTWNFVLQTSAGNTTINITATGPGGGGGSQPPLVAELNLVFTGSSLNSTWTPISEPDFSRFGSPTMTTATITADSWDMDALMGMYGSWTRVYRAGSVNPNSFDQVHNIGESQSGSARMGGPWEWNNKQIYWVDVQVTGGSGVGFQPVSLPFTPGNGSADMKWCVTFDMNATNSWGEPWPTGEGVEGACP